MVEKEVKGKGAKTAPKPKPKPKKEVNKIVTLKALVRLSHRGKTYEVGETFEEEVKEIVDDVVAKGLAKKV